MTSHDRQPRSLSGHIEEPHLSYSQVEMFSQCPAMYEAVYLDGKRPMASWHLVRGIAVDQILLSDWETGASAPPVEVMGQLEQAFADAIEQVGGMDFLPCQASYGRVQAWKDAADMIRYYLGRLRGLVRPLAVRQLLRRERPGGLPFVGILDAMEAEDVILDLKTSTRRMGKDDALRDTQATAYAYLLGRPIRFRWLRLMSTRRGVQHEIQESIRSLRSIALYERTVSDVERAIQAGIFPRFPGWHCAGCPIRGECYEGVAFDFDEENQE